MPKADAIDLPLRSHVKSFHSNGGIVMRSDAPTLMPVAVIVPALSSTLADLGGVGERILHAVPKMAWNFDTISARPGHKRNLMAPDFATRRRDGIAEGQECFWIPGSGSRLELS